MNSISTRLELHPKASWGKWATYIMEVEKKMRWKTTHNSFSSWMSDFAVTAGKSEAHLWTMLAAGRYYNELWGELSNAETQYPTLLDGELAAAPESLQLLDKISRVAPTELVKELKLKLMTGSVTRSELRLYWDSYREVLQGRTARGRHVPAPRFNPDDLNMMRLRMEANCVAGLVKYGARWLGDEHPALYRVIKTGNDKGKNQLGESLVVLHKHRKSSEIVLHGIKVYSNILPAQVEVYAELGFDFFWFALPALKEEWQMDRILNNFGMLVVKPDCVDVIKPAAGQDKKPEATEKLLRNLLRHMV
jgi:hypothetical protein